MRRTILSCLLPLAVLFACGSGDDSNQNAPSANLAPKLAPLANTVCDLAFRCCARGEMDWYIGPYIDKQNCSDRFIEHASLSSSASVDLYDYLKLKVSVPNIGALNRVEMNVDVRLTPEWWLQYAGHYDNVTRSIVNDQITVTRVFCDCLAVSLSYLAPQNEFWLESWLTAIPWARGRVGVGGRGDLLFNQPIPFIEH